MKTVYGGKKADMENTTEPGVEGSSISRPYRFEAYRLCVTEAWHAVH